MIETEVLRPREPLSLSFHDLTLTIFDIPQELHNLDRVHGEPFGTNESVLGLTERIRYVKNSQSKIGTFVGVGRPEKVICQAAMLQPTKAITHIDISGTNVLDSLILIAALKRGVDIETFITTYLTKPRDIMIFETDVYRRLCGYTKQEIEYLPDPWRVRAFELALSKMMLGLGLSYDQLVDTVQSIDQIKLVRGNIKDFSLLSKLIGKNKDRRSIIDFSNIPIQNDFGGLAKKENISIFSALNITDEVIERLGTYNDRTEYQGNQIWNYGTDGPYRRMPVVYSPTFDSYQRIVNLVDSAGNHW